MKIIDKKTGKRIVSNDKERSNHQKALKESDPIIVDAFKDNNTNESSPMNPPDAYDLSKTLNVNKDDFSVVLRSFIDEHSEVLERLEKFERSLINFKENNFVFTKDINDSFNEFFIYFDNFKIGRASCRERV